MRIFPKRRVLIGFGLGIFFFVAVLANTYSSDQSYQQAIQSLNQDKQVDALCASLLTEMLNAETGQRGYILTGNATYLQPYANAVQSEATTDQALKTAIEGDQQLTNQYQLLQSPLNAKLAELNESITVMQSQGFQAAQAIVNNNTGETYMNDLRSIIAGMTAYDDNLTATEQVSVNQLASQRLDSVYFNGILAAAFIIFAFYSLRQEFHKEEDLLKKEIGSRRQAELMQDILTHDIRNYNQITRASAELLGQGDYDDQSKQLVESIQRATDGSTGLIQKTRMLANIMSGEGVALVSVDLQASIARSLDLVRGAYPEKKIELTFPSSGVEAHVLADSLLDEVFVNALTNAVKYTNGPNVPIEIAIEGREETEKSEVKKYWQVSITDHGKGIADESKGAVFGRYLGQAKGRGLGLSITRALVVDRYSGKIQLKNRVEGDSTKGTRLEIWLQVK